MFFLSTVAGQIKTETVTLTKSQVLTTVAANKPSKTGDKTAESTEPAKPALIPTTPEPTQPPASSTPIYKKWW